MVVVGVGSLDFRMDFEEGKDYLHRGCHRRGFLRKDYRHIDFHRDCHILDFRRDWEVGVVEVVVVYIMVELRIEH